MPARETPAAASVLHITDLHLLGNPGDRLREWDTAASLEAVLAAATAERRPAALLVTGDIAHEPTAETYSRCLAILGKHHDGPLLCLPGNHDLLAPMREADMPMQSVRLSSWQLLGWDTHADDQPSAVFSETAWRALQEQIEQAQGPLVVATHHPLVDVGCAWLDKDRLPNAPKLLEYLAQASSVKSVVFGHAHQTVEARHRALPLLGTPSTCFQFRPRSRDFAIDSAAPGYRWLHLQADGGLRTEVARIKEEAGA